MNNFPVLSINLFLELDNTDFYSNNIVSHCTKFHNSITIPHKHDSYLIVLFTKGSGIHEIDFTTYEIKKGTVFLLNPGQTHHWELSDDIEGYIFVHTNSFYELYFSKNRMSQYPFFFSRQNSPCINIKLDNFDYIETLFRSINDEYDAIQIMSYQKIINLIDILYIDLYRLYIQPISDEKIKTNNIYLLKIKELEHLIETNYLDIKSPLAYSKLMNISTKHLNRIVKSLLNKTTQDLINERVILEAKRMLINPENSVSKISFYLGYDDESYFSRFFKKNCSETPREFSNRYK